MKEVSGCTGFMIIVVAVMVAYSLIYGWVVQTL